MNSRAFLPMLLVIALSVQACGPLSKSQAEQKIQAWYAAHPGPLQLSLTDANTKAEWMGYASSGGMKNILVLMHEGMRMELAFGRDVRQLAWSVDSLAAELQYVVVEDIPLGEEIRGWKVNPRVPTSSADGEVVEFVRVEEGTLAFMLRWRTYTVGGYSQSDYCQEEMSHMDVAAPEPCFVFVEQSKELVIEASLAIPTL